MKVHGGKARIATELSAVLLALRTDQQTYLEPFLGGCNVLPHMAPHFATSVASDASADLAALWHEAIVNGWRPPSSLSRAEWQSLRDGDPSPLRAFAGHGCSFGGMWFEGYAQCSRGDDYAGAAARGIQRKCLALQGCSVTVEQGDYGMHAPGVGTLVYADPPYAGTTPFKGLPPWDPERFWRTVGEWSDGGALVAVSEYDAPPGWECVWRKNKFGTLAAHSNVTPITERLFVNSAYARRATS